MYEKKIINYTIFIIIFIMLFFFTGCQSTRNCNCSYGEFIQSINANQRAIEQLKATESNLGFINESTREQLRIIGEKSREIGDTIDRIYYLFTEYERVVNEVLYSIERERYSIERNGDDIKEEREDINSNDYNIHLSNNN